MIQGVATQGHQITISIRNKEKSTALAKLYPDINVADNQAVVDNSNIIFLGSTAKVAREMLEPLNFKPGQRVVSFMAGISSTEVKELIKPATFVTVMIPFPSIAQGNSPILVYPAAEIIKEVFGERNTVIALNSQTEFNEFMSARAILSPIVKMLTTGVNWLAQKTGNTHSAEQFLRLLGGSILAEPIATQNALDRLIDSLSTPGGLNAQLREYMDKHHTYSNLEEGLEILSKRISSSQ